MITKDEFLNRMPSTEARKAVKRLMDVAKENHGVVYFGVTGISIRACYPAWATPLSVAWIYPYPGVRGWARTRDFTFGAGIGNEGFFESLRTDLREVLENWSRSASNGMYVTDVSSVGVMARSITHEDAAANIDVLAERLANVLRELAALPAKAQE